MSVLPFLKEEKKGKILIDYKINLWIEHELVVVSTYLCFIIIEVVFSLLQVVL